MRIIILLLLLNWSFGTLLNGQDCALETKLPVLEQAYKTGQWATLKQDIRTLLDCVRDQKANPLIVALYTLQYKFFRSLYKERSALKALQEVRKKIEADGQEELLDTAFLLLEAEAYAFTGQHDPSMAILDQIKVSIIAQQAQHPEWLARYQRILLHNEPNRDRPFIIGKLNALLANYEQLAEADVFEHAWVYQQLGILHRLMGDMEQSRNFFTQERDLLQSRYGPMHTAVGKANYNIGNAYYEMLEYQSALEHYLLTEKVWLRIKKPDDRYMRFLVEAIGDMYWGLGDTLGALHYFDRAVEVEQKVNNDSSEPITQKAELLSQQGQHQTARIHYQQALDIRKKLYGEDHRLTGACRNFVAHSLLKEEQPAEALQTYQRAIISLVADMTDTAVYANPSLDMEIKSNVYLLEALTGKGEALKSIFAESQQIEDLHTAYATQQLALEIVEGMRHGTFSESSRRFWNRKTLPLTESIINTAFQLYRLSSDTTYLEAAFDFAEKSKALLLLSAFREKKARAFVGIPDELVDSELDLRSKINKYKGLIEREEKRCGEQRSKLMTIWTNELNKLNNQYQLFLADLQNKHPDYYELKFAIPANSLARVREEYIQQDQAMIVYFWGTQHLYSWTLTTSGLKGYEMPIDSLLKNALSDCYESLANEEFIRRQPAASFEKHVKSARYLYDQLLSKPLKQLDSSIQHLVIVPDGSLAYIPFDMLLTSEVSTQKRNYQQLPYLLKSYALSYSPSAHLAVLSESAAKGEEGYFGFAPAYGASWQDSLSLTQLAHNRQEITSAADVFGGKHWAGNQVTEELVQQHIPSAGILHLAAHAQADDQFPLLTSLFFNQSDQEDGILHTYEILHLKTAAQLAILSGCNTAAGKWERGEGLQSLERAFQYAGCSSILATFWALDDGSAGAVIQPFLQNWKSGDNKAQALQKAKLSYLAQADPAHQHPYYWSGFKLAGSNQALQQASWNWPMAWVGGLLILLFCYFYFTKK